MANTTIAVEVGVRDRLAAQAAQHGHTLGEEVEALLHEREVREILAVGARLAADPRNAELVVASVVPAAPWRAGVVE
jgi:hypothetical protein